jgi:cell division protein FtsB
MSIREFLAEPMAAGRAALATTMLFALGAVVGCSSTVSDENIEQGIARPTQDAATIAEARAINLGDEINRLKQDRDALEAKRSDYLKQAAYYLAKSAAVWSDPSVAEKDRPALASQFTTLADESQAKADRYGQMADACSTRISLLESQRDSQLRRSENYRDMIVPVPSSE